MRIGELEREGLSGEEIPAGGSVWPVSRRRNGFGFLGFGNFSGFCLQSQRKGKALIFFCAGEGKVSVTGFL